MEDYRIKTNSKDFQKELLNLCEICCENNTDNCTLTFEYTHGVMEVDFTFRIKTRNKDNE